MGDDSSRKALEGHLASLLGFDEVSDVFEHLLTIEEEDDLSEYLSALLGLDGGAVSDFVQDMGRFQRGEKLVNISIPDGSDSAGVSSGNAPPASAAVPKASTISTREQGEDKVEQKMSSMKLDESKARKQQQQESKGGKPTGKRAKLNEARRQQQQQQQQQKEKLADAKAKEAAGENADKNVVEAASKRVPSKSAKETKKNDAPKPPQRGQAKVICGCFGTVHKPITNCLHCGRIACEREGYGYCGFCGFLIEKVTPVDRNSDGKFDKALLHKERLLKYDREFTKRTHVYDDQADYFSNATSMWLDENERNDAEERDAARQKYIHERKKQTLTLDL